MSILPFGSYGFSIAIYVISIMIAVSGISIGLGYAFNERRLKEFGRSELYQSIINGALVGGMLALFSSGGIVSSVINSVTVSGNTSLQCSSSIVNNAAICLAYDYLVSPTGYTFMGTSHQSVLTMSAGTLTALFGLNAVLGIIAAFKINLLAVTLSFNYVTVPLINEIQYLIKILSTIAISATVQAAVLLFIAVGTLSIILPAGLILRTFYPTRKLGGFFIALSIGLYVVLPLSYVFNIALVNSYSASQSSIGQVTLTASGIESGLFSFNKDSNSSILSGFTSSISESLSALSSAVSNLIEGLISDISYFIVYTFILPAFSLVITGISVRELAGILGSEVSFGRLNSLI